MDKSILKSRTFWGVLIAAVARVISAPPAERVTAAVEGAGAVISAVGLRSAIAVNGNGQ